MATSGPKRLVPPGPPADLATRKLPLSVPASAWFRMSQDPSPVFWSRLGKFRFDSPTAKWGVCYAAESISSCFLEIWGDKIRRTRRLSWTELESMIVWRLDVSPVLQTVELAGETLPVIRATMQSFVSSYPLSQHWGRELMAHPDDIDGLRYIARRCGRACFALFGDDAKPKDHQAVLRPKILGPLRAWKGLWPLLDRIQVAVHDLPASPPPADWS